MLLNFLTFKIQFSVKIVKSFCSEYLSILLVLFSSPVAEEYAINARKDKQNNCFMFIFKS